MFSDTFSQSFSVDNLHIPHCTHVVLPKCNLASIVFPISEVINQLIKLKPSRTQTPDGFSSYTIKLFGCSIARPLSLLFEHFFAHNFIPQHWKMSYINPVHKKGTRSNAANFRPIAITSILCRVMETVIHKQLIAYLTSNYLLSPHQHGFQSSKSSSTNLLESVTDWIFKIDAKNSIDVLYIDLSKAFDTVVHTKLHLKLCWYGISDNLLHWLTSFFTTRMQSLWWMGYTLS